MAKYGIFLTPDRYHIVAMKTTVATPADGDWDNQDNVILPAGGSPIKSMWVVEDGADFHVATQQVNGRVAYHVFDPGTDTWTIKDELVENAVLTVTFFAMVSIALRADGDVIICYGVANTQARYKRREAGVWSSEVTIEGVSAKGVVAIGPDSSDRITFVYTKKSSDEVRTTSLSSSNVLGTPTSVDASVDTATLLVAPGVIDTANLISVSYIDASNKISVAQFTSAAAPSPIDLRTDVSDEIVVGDGATVSPFIVACLVLDGTAVHLLYARDVDGDLYHDDNASVSSGGTETEIEDIVTANRVSVKKGTNDLLYFFDNAGVPTFGLVSLGPGDTVILAPVLTYTLVDNNAPTVQTGVTVAPGVVAYTLADNNAPQVGTSVLVEPPVETYVLEDNNVPTINIGVNVKPPAEIYTLTAQIPIVGSGVSIVVPRELYTLIAQIPTVTTLQNINIDAPLFLYTLNDNNEPLISIGVNIIVPSELFTLGLSIPIVGSGVNIIVPRELFTLTALVSVVGTGVIIQVPVEIFTLLDNNIPFVNTGVNITVPSKLFTLTLLVPNIGGGTNITVPVEIFTLNDNNAPLIATGVNVKPPVEIFTLNELIPIIGTGVDIAVPSETFTLTNFIPVVTIPLEIILPRHLYTLAELLPTLHTVSPISRDILELDLTPPFEDGGQLRYLFENFELLKLVLEEGITGQFTTADGKIVHIRNGIIVDIFV